MAECLGLLALGSLEDVMRGENPSGQSQLTYQDFGLLRPRYADSTWRVTLSRMAQRRLVIKTYRSGLTAYQLSKEGWEQWKALNPVILRFPQKEWGLLFYQASVGEKQASGSVRRALQASGFEVLIPGLAISPRATYSDYLIDEIRRLGYRVVFLPVQPDKAKPVPLMELLADPDRTWRLARDSEKISKEIDELLMQLATGKTLKNQSKERIGSALLSGLNFIRQLNWYDLELVENDAGVIQLARKMDELLRQYALNNLAWKTKNN